MLSAIPIDSNELYVLSHTGVAATYEYVQSLPLHCLDMNQAKPHLQGVNDYEETLLCSHGLPIAVTLNIMTLVDNEVQPVVSGHFTYRSDRTGHDNYLRALFDT